MGADCTCVPAGTSKSPLTLLRVNSNTPLALVAPLRSTFTAQASMSSQAPVAVFTKKFGSTVPLIKVISHSTGLVTRAVTMRQNGE